MACVIRVKSQGTLTLSGDPGHIPETQMSWVSKLAITEERQPAKESLFISRVSWPCVLPTDDLDT